MKENPRSTWRTPKWLFDLLNEEFFFTMDAAASKENALCPHYFDREDDALRQRWGGDVFVNPPYSGERYGEYPLAKWVKKAYSEATVSADSVVMLLPADSGTEWFRFAFDFSTEIRLITPRIEFDPPPGVKRSGNRGPSCVVVFDGCRRKLPGPARVWLWNLTHEAKQGRQSHAV